MKIADIRRLLDNREFINLATADHTGRPNVAPKFILKIEGVHLYLVDYVMGRSYENLKENQRVSLSLMDLDTLIGYQMNGTADLIEKGQAYDALYEELTQREVSLSAKRVLEGIDKGRRHKSFEVTFSDHITMIKVKVQEFVEISPQGKLRRETVTG